MNTVAALLQTTQMPHARCGTELPRPGARAQRLQQGSGSLRVCGQHVAQGRGGRQGRQADAWQLRPAAVSAVSWGVRAHAQLPAVDLKSTPIIHSGKLTGDTR